MSVAVRYYSRSGNTKAIAEAIAKAAGVHAVSVDAPMAGLEETADVLFIGGALYAYGIDENKDSARKAVVFSSTWISRHSIDLIKKGLRESGIPVAEESFYVRGKPSDTKLKEAETFAKKYI